MNQNRYSLNVYSLRVNETAPLPNGEKINGPDRARQILSVYFSEHRDDREHMIALALTNQLEILGIVKVAEGGSGTTIVDPKVLFRALMVSGACKFVLGHNHPSGHPYPSPEDLALRFENVPKETARELEKLVAALPDVESLERSESESMGTVLTEIVT